MTNTIYNTDIISIKDLNLDQIQLILQTAAQFKENPVKNLLANRIIANCFFEPSTRTRLSFETATLRLGGQVIGFSDSQSISQQKGEMLIDSIKVISEYADLIVIRHPQEGAARLAAQVSDKSVINAGDGANQHPTQALIDLFTIQESQGSLKDINIALVGDLKYGRTVHSLIQACALFNVRMFLVAPELLSLPENSMDYLKQHGIKFSFHQTIEEIIHRIDILYMTRVQQERTEQMIKNPYRLTTQILEKANANLRILHPLPRNNEIDPAIDNTPFAAYFPQAANGVFIRQALLALLLNF